MSYIKPGRQVKDKPHFLERHHAFWGLIGMLIGFASIYFLPKSLFVATLFGHYAVVPMIVIGLWCLFWAWVFFDDIVQHVVQMVQYRKLGFYDLYTFWHWWFYDLMRKLHIY